MIHYFMPPVETKLKLRFLSGVEHFFVFFDCVPVCHACNVIAGGAFESALFDEELDVVRQGGGFGAIGVEQVLDDPLRFFLHADDAIVPVQFLVEQILQFAVASLHFFAVSNDIMFQFLNISNRIDLAFL